VSVRTLSRWVGELGLEAARSRAESPTHACTCGLARANHSRTSPHACALSGCAEFRGTGKSARVRAVGCAFEGCPNKAWSRGLCPGHYAKKWRRKKAAGG
jgi:hypothetical protein